MNSTTRRWRPLAYGASVVAALAGAVVSAAAQELPRLHTNQAEVEEATKKTALKVEDPLAVFAFVLNSLPDRVKVYPTENYYYFSFVHNGVPYGGNIRLDASNRDQGKVSFGYSMEIRGWRDVQMDATKFALLDETQGVKLEKLDRFLYRLSYRDKSVLFELNDLSKVRPPEGVLAPDEKYLGPIFDESAIRLFLVYNPKLKLFHYILDETVPIADILENSATSDRILIGTRTGFAFYRDHLRDRKILIGVFSYNSFVNNYFDGPFDQLPDNFQQGDELREAILQVDPELKGKVDRFGGSFDGEFRFMIAPYIEYGSERDLRRVDSCARRREKRPPLYYRCFNFGDADARSRRAVPRKGKR